ncbi:MAG: ClpXP protease specificity-enhancing factor [Curvibacter sp.]
MTASGPTSTRPYLIRALYEWCTDNGLTPYVAVRVDDTVRVPREYVKDGEIVLNISMDATSALKLGNEYIEFKARFAGVAREIMIPLGRVMAIYARENGQGMAFPLEEGEPGVEPSAMPAPEAPGETTPRADRASEPADDEPEPPRPPAGAGRPALKRIK